MWCLHWWFWTYFTPFSSVSVTDFEQVYAELVTNWTLGQKTCCKSNAQDITSPHICENHNQNLAAKGSNTNGATFYKQYV